MKEEITAQKEGSGSLSHNPGSNPPTAAHSAWAVRVTANPPAAISPTRSRRKKILVPVVLTVIGLALLLVGFLVYPRRAEPPTPLLGAVFITGASGYVSHHIEGINFRVDQVHPDLARLTIQIQLTTAASRRHGQQAVIGISDLGLAIMHCSPSCIGIDVARDTAQPHVKSDGTATAYFLVKAHSFGVAANGVTASAAFPQLFFSGTRPATMTLTYNIPSADSYDWSAYPPSDLSNTHATWEEPFVPNQLPLGGGGQWILSRVVTGINHAAETSDSTLTLIAGVLFGLGGGALVAAIQEALHD
jgi:hypothetical protein